MLVGALFIPESLCVEATSSFSPAEAFLLEVAPLCEDLVWPCWVGSPPEARSEGRALAPHLVRQPKTMPPDSQRIVISLTLLLQSTYR